MTPSQRLSFHFSVVIAALCLSAACASGQGLRPVDPQTMTRPVAASTTAMAPGPAMTRPSPSIPVAAQPSASAAPRSLLDQPASQARVQVTGDRLTVTATNASLSEVIRQVAARTGMQVEGNSHDERVFGVYGPGSPLDVLSSLLYDSGYNVMMVGSTPDGAPRRLLLSPRTAGAGTGTPGVPNTRNADEDEEAEQPQEQPPQLVVPQPVNQGATPAAPAAPGTIKTPQQMLEELQKMHLGQQPQQETPRE